MGRLTNCKELLAFLESEGLAPNRTLSQNFLIDGNIVQKIMALAKIEPGDRVLEIGPGPGAMTEVLLEKGAEVTAIEKDRDFARLLGRLNNGHLVVHEADCLTFDLAQILQKAPLKIIANIPYHLTTSIFFRFLPLFPHVISLTLMIQKEVADRLQSRPGTKEHSVLTLYRELYSDILGSFIVTRNCFYPQPKVESTVLHLQLKKAPADIDPDRFLIFLQKAFRQRRKLLSSNLVDYASKEIISSHLKNPKARPEELSLNEFLDLFRSIASANGDEGKGCR